MPKRKTQSAQKLDFEAGERTGVKTPAFLTAKTWLQRVSQGTALEAHEHYLGSPKIEKNFFCIFMSFKMMPSEVGR